MLADFAEFEMIILVDPIDINIVVVAVVEAVVAVAVAVAVVAVVATYASTHGNACGFFTFREY